MISVMVADDHAMFRKGLAQALAADGDISVVGEADTINGALNLAGVLQPEVLVLDAWMDGSVLANLAAISAAAPQARIVVLTNSQAATDVAMAVEGGAVGYILKGISAADMRAAIRMVRAGGALFDDGLTGEALEVLGRTKTEI